MIKVAIAFDLNDGDPAVRAYVDTKDSSPEEVWHALLSGPKALRLAIQRLFNLDDAQMQAAHLAEQMDMYVHHDEKSIAVDVEDNP